MQVRCTTEKASDLAKAADRRDPSAARLVLSLAFVLSLPLPALALLSDAEAVTVIEKAKIVTADARVQARVGAGEVAVSAYRNPKATDRDCKIDAILIAKSLMDADPKGVVKVKVRFYDPANRTSYREVNVGTGVVKAFGEGRLSQDELLSSVVLDRGDQDISRYSGQSYSQISKSPEVVDGAYRGERLNLLSRIQMLRQKGVGVQPFLGEFFAIEDKARRGDDAGVADGIGFLSQKINEMERRYEQARAPRAPRTVPGNAQPAYTPHHPPAAGHPGQYGHPGGGVEQAMQGELGELAPVPGPRINRRYRIARRIADLQAEGRMVDPYLRLYREIQDLAARGDLPALKLKLTYAEHQLGLPSFDE